MWSVQYIANIEQLRTSFAENSLLCESTKFANTGIEMKESKDSTIDYRTQNNEGHVSMAIAYGLRLYPDGGHVYKIDKSP